MASVNASRDGTTARMANALRGARLLAWDDDGHVCAWYGGYGFNVYDAARDWTEIQFFNSGRLAAGSAMDRDPEEVARERMEMAGFENFVG